MLRIAICDDTTPHAKELAELIDRELSSRRRELEGFPSPDELLRYITSGGYAPDIAFLGVGAGGGRGIELGAKLNALVPACRIIFVSDTLDAVRDVYCVEHIWYILRSELSARITPALEKALSSLEAKRGTGLVIRAKGRAVFLPLGELLYLERDLRRTLIHTESGEYVSSERPCQLLGGELERCFVRSHRSYWVNKSKISEMESDAFILRNGQRVPISRGWRAAARAAFLASES